MPEIESGKSFGKYTLVERIGAGCMAEVFKVKIGVGESRRLRNEESESAKAFYLAR